MSRAVRRHPAAAPKERPARQPRVTLGPGGAPRQTRGARAPQEKRPWFRPRVPRFMDDTIAELKKVTWPTWPETRYLSFVVIVVSLAVGITLGLTDVFFNWLIDHLLLK